LGSALLFWPGFAGRCIAHIRTKLVAIGGRFFISLIALAITTIELLSGYRGPPQSWALVLAGASCVVPVIYFVALVGSSAAN
jgi:hypothetical protein